jgi:hypothetical protein
MIFFTEARSNGGLLAARFTTDAGTEPFKSVYDEEKLRTREVNESYDVSSEGWMTYLNEILNLSSFSARSEQESTDNSFSTNISITIGWLHIIKILGGERDNNYTTIIQQTPVNNSGHISVTGWPNLKKNAKMQEN